MFLQVTRETIESGDIGFEVNERQTIQPLKDFNRLLPTVRLHDQKFASTSLIMKTHVHL